MTTPNEQQSSRQSQSFRDFDIDTAEGEAQDAIKEAATGDRPAKTERNQSANRGGATYAYEDPDADT